MRRMTQAAMIWIILFLAIGCGTRGHDPVEHGYSGEVVELPEKQIDLGDGITLEMLLIPAGEFLMGSPELERKSLNAPADGEPAGWAEREKGNGKELVDPETPQHRVRIARPFYLGKYPVTQEQWVALMIWNPSGESIGRRKPVERVSWNDCQEFIKRLNERLGDTVGEFRLPTEAEWEYACRAGTTTQYSFGDDAARLDEHAWYAYDSGRTRPVGQKNPNRWGLYDMHGNVYEWCADWFDANYYASSPVDDPPGPVSGSARVLRGGSWLDEAWCCRSAYRFGEEPKNRYHGLGFRLVLVPVEGKTTEPEAPVEPPKADEHPSATRKWADPPGPWKLPPGVPEPAIAPFDAGQARRHQEAWAEHLGQPVEVTNSIGMKLRLIPPGQFMMGSPEWDEEGRRNDESPQHVVRITRPFYLGVYEVTQEEYERVMDRNPSMFTPDGSRSKQLVGLDTSRFPVEAVSWKNAVEFCRRLSALPAERSDGREYRLPTEAEWEYACRAGTTTPFHFGTVLDGRQANCNASAPYGARGEGRRLGRTTTVGSYSPNGFGLFDVHGNVREWCADWYNGAYYATSPVDDPTGPSSGWVRVSRGGGWACHPVTCRSAARNRGSAGFRVALVAVDE